MESTTVNEDGLGIQEPEPQNHSDLFLGLARELIRARMADVPAPPSLFHYTSAAGLIGVLEKNTLWFSNSMFLNDGSESFWGINVFEHVLDEFLTLHDADARETGDKLKRWVRDAFNFFQPIVFCMSEEDNLLNQWRDYGKDVTPYSIELATDGLEQDGYNFPAYLCEVIYDMNDQREMAARLVELIYNKYRETEAVAAFREEDEEPLLIGAAKEIVWLLSRFKNTAFQAEKEWRLICHRPNLDGKVKTLFRAGSLGAVPYYEWFRPTLEGRGPLPIIHVTVGPSPYSAVSDIALKQLLHETGYGDVPTHYSLIPIRRG
ncbi:DUF2971 domain-containing protein [Rhizobium sp. 32-5/1]|uniref:DUF2971 domain-containing protein n=1 Tax=Rhizobium sp. 32-5/1 TaxID=3019602 RepID=UPI00240DB97E|nr:DUF2971 domain-containing protein [Rhizobium sp. 32-5/1]WEZ84564.1 DUF2971 domain-containing protein [Rhizobium sp. 32-5/1]